MDRIGTALFIILCFLVVIWIAVPMITPKKEKTLNDEFKGYISKYVSATASLDNYKRTYDQNLSGELKKVYVEKSGSDYRIELAKEEYSWILTNVGGNMLCLRVGLSTACTEGYTENASLVKIAYSLRSIKMDSSSANSESKWFSSMFDSNAINVKQKEQKKDCTAFYYTYSYKNLSLGQLEKMGLSSGSPAVAVAEYDAMMCIDENGILREKYSKYRLQGNDVFEHLKVKEMKAITGVEKTADTADSAAFNGLLFDLIKLLTAEKQGNLTDLEWRSLAVDIKVPQLCKRVSEPLSCADIYMSVTKDPKVCEAALAGNDINKCYYQAGTTIDAYYCNFITDAAMKTECMNSKKGGG